MLSGKFQRKGLVENHLSLDIADFTPYVGRIGRRALVSWDNSKSQIGTIAYPESVRLVYTSTCTGTGAMSSAIEVVDGLI